jgi:hypothetical protein
MRFWFDTEFIDTGKQVHLLSIGIVSEDGRTYYAEPDDAPKELACEWVQKNVLPHLTGEVKPRRLIAADIHSFCGARPEFWAYFASYDWLVLCQIYGRMLDVPAHWPNFVMDVQQLRIELGVGNLPKQESTEHNALNDAIWTKLAWEFLMRAPRV